MGRSKIGLAAALLSMLLWAQTVNAQEHHEEGGHHSAPENKPAQHSVPAGAIPHPAAAPHPQEGYHQDHPQAEHRDVGGEHRDVGGEHRDNRMVHWDHPRFRAIDPLWIAGYWYEGWFAGVYGWWWVVGGQHFLYDTPIYPYPTFISDQVIDAPPAPQPTAYTVSGQGQNLWYFCDNPQGYYPYVQACSVPFKAVLPH